MKNKTKDKPDTIVIKKLKTENRQSDKAQANKNAVFFRKHIAAFILVISALCLSGVLLAFLHFNNKSTPASADAHTAASSEALSETTSEATGTNSDETASTSTAEDNSLSDGTAADASTTDTKSEPVSINIMMIGDMLIHEGVYNSGKLTDGSYNFDHLFKNILNDINNSDIRIVNQETILGGTSLGLSGYPCFNSPYEIGDAEAKAGFNVILHATNHSLDKGVKGINNCTNYWKSKHPEMAVLGLFNNPDDAGKIYVYEKNDFKVAILNYTYGTNGIEIPSSMPYCVNILNETKIRTDVTRAKELADMVIVCPHWGTEYVYQPDSNQKYWTNLFLSLGVDVVIGSHPHVLEPVEMLTGSDGHQMLVYYSLGNFVSNQSEMPRMIGGMADITLIKEADGSHHIKSYSLTPVVTHKKFGHAEITTYKLQDYNNQLAQDNAIRKDEGCSSFSYEYCVSLCKKILGNEFNVSTCSLNVNLN